MASFSTTATHALSGTAQSGLITWTKQRAFGSGPVTVKITDISLWTAWIDNSNQRVPFTVPFAYADFKIGLYKVGYGAGNGPRGSVTIRKQWGVALPYKSIVTVPSGSYRLQTQLVGAYNSSGSLVSLNNLDDKVVAAFSVNHS